MAGKPRKRAHRLVTRIGVAIGVTACAAMSLASVAAAEPVPSVIVKADQATLVALAGEPATVLIGNALFADVTLKKGMIFIHGRQYGTTNVIVLDKDNAKLADFELHVVRGGSQNVTITKGNSAFSYLCAPNCQSSLQVGDNSEYFDSVSSGMSAKQQLSMGAGKLGE